MKQLASVSLVLVLSIGYDEPVRFRIYLTTGQLWDRVEIVHVGEDSLRTGDGRSVDLMRVGTIEVAPDPPEVSQLLRSVGTWAAVGACVGASIGWMTGVQADDFGFKAAALDGCAIGAGVGGFAGVVMACASPVSRSLQVAGLPRSERYREIQQFLKSVVWEISG